MTSSECGWTGREIPCDICKYEHERPTREPCYTCGSLPDGACKKCKESGIRPEECGWEPKQECIESKLKRIAEHYGLESRIELMEEECAELIHAISKNRRAIRKDTPVKIEEARNMLIEELADVQFMTCQLVYLLGCGNEIEKIANKKADYLLEKIKQKKKPEKRVSSQLEQCFMHQFTEIDTEMK